MFKGKSVAITGASGGIGRGLAEMFIAEGAKVAISDLESPVQTAKDIGAEAFKCDVSKEQDVIEFIDLAEAVNGPIDIYCSNAGLGFSDNGHAANSDNAAWDTSWQVNLMGSVYAARALLPAWVERGSGHFAITASAAGLLNQIGSATYSVTKHAAVGLAEAIGITHYDDGIRAHCICPQFVRSNMTKGMNFAESHKDGLLEPSDVANALKNAIENDEFMVLSHPAVADYFRMKANDYNGWITGMAAMRRKFTSQDTKIGQ